MTTPIISAAPRSRRNKGLRVERRYTTAGQDPFSGINWVLRQSRIGSTDGSSVFEMADVEVPDTWDQVATDILASKYFRKAGVPQHTADSDKLFDANGTPITGPELGPEHSLKQVAMRMANAWMIWGQRAKMFASDEDALAYRDEMAYMIVTQMGAPNTPAWFNVGLFEAYNIIAEPEGNWYWDPAAKKVRLSNHRYERAAVNACFISAVGDKLVGENSIFEFIENEARLFKSGSGSGANFSNIRGKGEKLSAGGTSSGVMSFLRVADRAAGAIKSGGSTRRAAKMVILDADHPEIEDFIWCKVREEEKVAALVAAGYSSAFEGEAYETVSFQNGNNTVRVSEEFMHEVEVDGDWNLTARTDGSTMKTVKARKLWDDIAEASWRCADPGLQFDGTLNAWNTAADTERVRGTNPCFPADVRVLTDRGFVAIGQLYEDFQNGATVRVWTHDRTNTDNPADVAALTEATSVFETGINPIVRLTFSNGLILRCTPNHAIFTLNRGWVSASELTETDQVLASDVETGAPAAELSIPAVTRSCASLQLQKSAAATSFPTEWTTEFAHLLGWLVGDGSLTADTVIWVYGSKADQNTIMPLHAKTIEHIFGVKPSLYKAPNGSLQLRVYRTPVASWLNSLGFTISKMGSNDKCVPWSIAAAPDAILGAFLSGLFDADGSVQQKSSDHSCRQITLSTASATLAADVTRELVRLGIRARHYTKQRSGSASLPGAGGSVRTLPRNTEYVVLVPWVAAKRFNKIVGFAHPEKAARLEGLCADAAVRGAYKTPSSARLVKYEEDGVEVTYNLTEPRNHSYIAEGIVVRNCSEYTHVDNTACNLASLNLVKFFDSETQRFDVESYEHAIRLWTITLEIHVTMSHYPSAEIAAKSYQHRTLGLGYCNIGAVLMRAGLAYDSEPARAAMAAITALMTGVSYKTSAEMAGVLEPCEAFEPNRGSVLRVLRNHRRAAYGSLARRANIAGYEGLNVPPVELDHLTLAHTPFATLSEPVITAYEDMYALAEKNGLRNMQTSVLAPTGTISLVMAADTTGIEPDFALVKMKKLAGGGYMQIINQSVQPALRSLGYRESAIENIKNWMLGTHTLHGDTPISSVRLAAAGFTSDEINSALAALPAVTDLTWAFGPHIIGRDAYDRLGVDMFASGGDLLAAAGFTPEEINISSKTICGHLTVEGCPDLKVEHLPVFDCAVECGDGTRVIHWTGHVKALAAAQPFVSGAISKTINMPNSATVEEVKEAHELAYHLGVKCVAIYRDGSKLSQPLNSAKSSDESDTAAGIIVPPVREIVAGMSPAEYYNGEKPPRFRLPDARPGMRWRVEVGGEEMYIGSGEYPDGSVGEVFIDWGKQGSTLRGVTSSLAIAISQALQHGVPLERIIKALKGHTYEPRGVVTGHGNLKMASSVVDAVVRILGYYYLGDTDLVQVPTGPIRSNQTVQLTLMPHQTADPALLVTQSPAEVAADVAFETSVATVPDGHKAGERLYGETCSSCGGTHMIKAGTCKVCGDCGSTTGCS